MMSRPVIGFPHAASLLANHFATEDLDRLRAKAEIRILGSNQLDRIADALPEVEILLGTWGMPRLTPDLLLRAPRLRAVCYAAGSVKGFATPAAFARGLIITTAMSANAIPVAEVCVALITLANKDWFRSLDAIRADGSAGWIRARQRGCRGNYGTTVGLVGFGAIGRLVADRLRPMALPVIVYDPHVDAALITQHGAQPVTDLLDLARRSMVVSLHAPDIDACAGMIGRDFLAAMPDGATLINTARGRVVDEAALISELTTGRIDALLDVTWPAEPPAADSPLYRLPNCWLSPHRAGSIGDEVRRLGRYSVDECLRIIAGEEPHHRVTEAMLATMA